MAKYNEAFKLSVVQDYEPGQQGCKALANKYHLDHALVRRWVKSYEQHGLDGLRKNSATTLRNSSYLFCSECNKTNCRGVKPPSYLTSAVELAPSWNGNGGIIKGA